MSVPTGSQNNNNKIAQSPEPQWFGALLFSVNKWIVKLEDRVYNKIEVFTGVT